MAGKCVVKRPHGNFNAVSADMALEHTINWSQKSASGTIGNTRNKKFVAMWEFIYHEMLAISNLFEELSGVSSSLSKEHVISIDNKLSFGMHITEKVNKANSVVGAIRRSFEYLDKNTFKKLYAALVRPHLEYANVVWNPYKKKDITTLENVQRRATKMVPGLGDKSYDGRLKD